MADLSIDLPISIYKITLRGTARAYIGITNRVNPERRFQEHVWDARKGKNGALFNAIRKYGAEAFDFEIIYVAVDQREACAVERALIAQYGTFVRVGGGGGFNMSTGGELSSGVARSAATKAKLRAAAKAQWADPEAVAKMRAGRVGHKPSQAHINHLRRLAAAMKGKKRSRESVEKGRAKLMGHAVSEETRAKISASTKGRPPSPIATRKLIERTAGRKRPLEERLAISNGQRQSWSDPIRKAERLAKIAATRATNARRGTERDVDAE